MSDEERAAAIAALTKAREQDAAAAEKAAQRSANALAACGQERTAAQQKLAAGYQKLWIKPISLWGKWVKSSKGYGNRLISLFAIQQIAKLIWLMRFLTSSSLKR